MATTLSSKGQIVIPSRLRKKYNLHPGSKVTLLDFCGEMVLVPIPDDPITEARGYLKSVVSVRDMMDEYRREENKLEKDKVRKLNRETENEK